MMNAVRAAQLDSARTHEREHKHVLARRPNSWATRLSFLLMDMVALALVGITVVSLAGAALPATEAMYLCVSHGALLIGAFALVGLYDVLALHPAQEIRWMTLTTALISATVTVSAWIGAGDSMGVVAVAAWMSGGAVLGLPASRALGRVLFSRFAWWGIPVTLVGDERMTARLLAVLGRWPELGYRPVALYHLEAEELRARPTHQVALRLAPSGLAASPVGCAIVALPELSQRELNDLLGRFSRFYRRVFVLSAGDLPSLWTGSQAMMGFLGYEVKHRSWQLHGRSVKRLADLIGAVVALLLALPFLLVIGVLIRLDSPGPVFYRQIRMGRDGRCFLLFKFRTMYENAEDRLRELLASDDEIRREYERFHKLRKDPRVTPIGRVLRRYSLDEMPQLINVLLGHMSLVGPRAYLPRELEQMEGLEHVILQTPPGVTGLWQVSGRNALTFEERVHTDVHYVYNWSPWLDFYILARTLPVVWTGEGAC